MSELGMPKSGKMREIPLSDDLKAALTAHRHLRGQSSATRSRITS